MPHLTRLQRFLLEHWRAALGGVGVGLRDDLSDLGADDAARARLLQGLESELGEPLYSVALFEAPSVEAFGAYLERHYPRAVARVLGRPAPSPDARHEAGIDAARLAEFRRWVRPPAGSSQAAGREEPMNGPAVFVLAPPRSGTTLFRVMLAGHPRLFAPPELELLGFDSLRQRRAACAGGYEPLLEGSLRAVMELRGCDLEQARGILAELEARSESTIGLYRLMQDWLGDSRLVDKTTSYALDPQVLARAEAAFDAPLFLHLTRHPAATVDSFARSRLDRLLFRGRHPFSPRELGELVWTVCHRNIVEFLATLPARRQHRVRFEDLVARPRSAMEEVCRFLGIGFDERLLSPYDGDSRRMTAGVHVPARMQGDPGFHRRAAIDADASREAERSELPLSESTRELAALLGYACTTKRARSTPGRRAASLPAIFEQQVRLRPNAVAVECGDEQLTYAALESRAEQLAAYLRGIGVRAETLVGLCVERSPAMLVGLLGILKAGGAYLPLEPSHPPERLAGYLADAGVTRVVTQATLAIRLPEAGIRQIRLDADRGAFDGASAAGSRAPILPEHPAYAIYTSGSTGEPKGVLVLHRGACNVVEAEIEAFEVGATSRVLQFASLGFDTSVVQIFMALGAGARLVLVEPDALYSSRRLLALLRERSVTHADLPPSVLANLPDAELPALRVISSGGERCSSETVARWSRGRRFFHCYGTTETSICSAMLACHDYQDTGGAATPPIGRAMPGTTLHVLDAELRPLPVGAAGELCVGGVGLARGYLGDPVLTAARFVPDPLGSEPGARLYRTGDLARLRADGNLELLGRLDDQVKIRGVRVEPGEVEAALRRHPDVREAVVVAQADGAGGKRLVAYLVPRAGRLDAALESRLRSFLRERLPEALVPSLLVPLEAIPRTASHKLDRAALPVPAAEPSSRRGRGLPPPTGLGQSIAEVWRAVLARQELGWHDNFFDLGGNSLLLAEVHARLCELLGREIPVVDLFRHPTLAGLAAHLGSEGSLAPGFAQLRERAARKRRRAARRRAELSAPPGGRAP